MKINLNNFEGLNIVKINQFRDSRGILKKFYNKQNLNMGFNIFEAYTTISKRGSVRGLHGQYGKYSQAKLIYCLKGKIMYVGIDLRKKSKTYKKIFKKIINSDDNEVIIIPKGFAHGIITLKNQTIVININSSQYNSKWEFGINFNSLSIKLPKIKLKITNKDKKLPSLTYFLKNKK